MHGQLKTVEIRIFHPIPLVFVGFHPEILTGSLTWGVEQGRGGKTSHFLDVCVNISKTSRDTSTITIND